MSHQQLSGRFRPRTQWRTAICALALVLFLVGSIFVAGCSSTKSDSGSVSNVKMAEQEQAARDATTPFRFVESLYSIGEWIGPHRLQKPQDLLWYADSQPEQGLYRCRNDYRATETTI